MTYEYYYPPMSYSQIVATQGEVIKGWTVGDWQGDYVYLLKNGDKYGFTVIGYGSCTGCDSLQACENDKEFNELKEDIIKHIFWGTKQEVLDYAFNENANRWYYHEEDFVEIQKEIREMLK